MNQIKAIARLNETELANATPPSASWHADYRDTSFIYIGGLPSAPPPPPKNPSNPSKPAPPPPPPTNNNGANNELTEGDVVTIFSQYGEPVYINLVRDRETGRSKGFAFLKYEDQRSCDLAVDNLGGAEVLGRKLRVEHVRYKVKEGERIYDNTLGDVADGKDGDGDGDGKDGEEEEESEAERPLIKEEVELGKLMREMDDEDPMKGYLVEQKREEIREALARAKGDSADGEGKKRKHRHRHREGEEGEKRKKHGPRVEKADRYLPEGGDREGRRRRVKEESEEDVERSERRRRRDRDRDDDRDKTREKDSDSDRRHHKSRRSHRERSRSREDRRDRSRSRDRERHRSRRYS
ncbi:hypothetical protein LTS18_009219 [Coniosporium uncinatum]|uniref:Uncharacterized protein n=1 Tax=Coniosporium uncinatum TaxID=93489 RepID=A0ACC3DMI2_9PEZI|nr:hypothetical protein LTS18_009219 [Coniosporium uncinatum]